MIAGAGSPAIGLREPREEAPAPVWVVVRVVKVILNEDIFKLGGEA